ncbi:MAG: hypothetical protein QHH06_11730 [Clostridiales bacterium]|nr:hypothetical protein [Eubacteriales bacterium]MDH7567128.1 hypothetical protein [Clostridiales bacterium]
MTFEGKIIKEKSYDPYFEVEFTYEDDEVKIEKGRAEIVRKAPRSEITFDIATEDKFKSLDRTKLELELLNLVINYMFDKRSTKTLRK